MRGSMKTAKIMFRSLLVSLCAAILIFSAAFTAYAEETSETPVTKPVITSNNIVSVRSVDTGQVLIEAKSDVRVPVTVIAKLVSAMVIYDSVSSLDDNVTVPAEATLKKNVGEYGDIAASMLGLAPGNVLTVRQLMTATLVSAAGDACYTLAYYVTDGDITGFIAKMNEKATAIGCKNTLFTSPVGLNDGDAYTTGNDASLIAAAFYKYNTLLEIASMPTYILTKNTIHTKNYLLSDALFSGSMLQGARGMIAGQARTDGGYCLVTSATKDGLGYVFVVMEAPGEERTTNGKRSFPAGNAYEDVHKVFNWAITSFGYVELVTEREIIGELGVTTAAENTDHVNYVTANAVELLLPVGVKAEDVERRVALAYEKLEAPVAKNLTVGRMELYYEGEKLATVDLVTNAGIEVNKLLSFFGKFKRFLRSATMRTIVKIIVIIVMAYFLFIIACIVYRIIIKANARAERQRRLTGGKPEPKRKHGKKRIAKPKPDTDSETDSEKPESNSPDESEDDG